jgi:hypothetical protein
MQSVIRKVKSLPIFSRKDSRQLTPAQFNYQANELDELIDIMIKDAANYHVLFYPRNSYRDERQHLYPPNSCYLIESEVEMQRLLR